MAKNVYSLQLLRNSQVFDTKELAIAGITGSTTQDGVIKLARYTDGSTVKTIFGIYNDNTVGTAGYTIYDSYKEVIEAIQERIADLESGSTEAIEDIWDALGDGVSSANTVTDQLEALSGDTASTSADTSVEGAKRYADEKVADAVADLDYTDTAVEGQYVSAVDETNGVISVTRVALPSLSEVYEEGKPIIAVSEDKGQVAASAGTINAEFVNVADSGNLFTGSTVEAVLAEIDAAYKAADAAIIGGASASADTLGELEELINNLSADAKEYSIVKTTTGLPETIKERYSLQDASGNTSGATIDIPKDSHIVSITYDGTTQKLTYTYIDASGNTQSTDVDMSELILETEFASGITVTNHVAHGVVDPTSEKDSNNDGFLTVGADGFKVDGIKDEIDAKIAALDASVTGGTTAGTATADHIQVVVGEADGKLTAVTVTETNIADADDLAALSAKTVTEIASSNSSISATSSAAADGTVKYDVITDASKIKMSGFTHDASGFTAITEDSYVKDAIKAIETAFLANEDAVNDALDTKIENIVVNSVKGTVNENIASVTIGGDNIKLTDYESGASGVVVATDSVNDAISKLQTQISAAVAGGVTAVTAADGINVDNTDINNPVVSVKLKENVTTQGSEWENPLKFDSNGGLYFDSLDCGTY